MSSAINFLNYVKTTPFFLFANYTMTVIPLFILMGALAEQSASRGISSRRRAPASGIARVGSPWR